MHLLQTYPAAHVEARIYPTYATRGSLERTVDDLLQWLVGEMTEYESLNGPASVVFCGHSMGGLVAMDAALELKRSTPRHTDPWPKVVGVLAYDTPYLGGTSIF